MHVIGAGTPIEDEGQPVFFVVSKIVGFLLNPINFVALVGLVGFVLTASSWRRFGRGVSVGAIVVLAVLCFSPIGGAILRPLEDRFPQPPLDMPAPTGIIVLGGSIDPNLEAARGQPAIREAAARLTTGAALALRFPSARLVFTGGSAELVRPGKDEAQGVRRLWLSLGIPAGRMSFEDASRNTRENATMTKALIRPKPGETWLLVTSAAHMPRSVGIFRKVDWSVVPYPVDYRTFGDSRDFEPTADGLGALERITVGVHEWTGLVAYYLTGKTNALFPAP